MACYQYASYQRLPIKRWRHFLLIFFFDTRRNAYSRAASLAA
jgi:hypothetical protein